MDHKTDPFDDVLMTLLSSEYDEEGGQDVTMVSSDVHWLDHLFDLLSTISFSCKRTNFSNEEFQSIHVEIVLHRSSI